MFKSVKLIVGLCMVATTLFGCVSIGPDSVAKTTSKGFVAKKDYSVSYDRMWSTVKRVLEDEQISIASTDRKEGIIKTEYIKGSQKLYISLLGAGGITKQYKYTINLSKSKGYTHVNIIAIVEVQEAEGAGWRPLGDANEQKLHENWLYEKLEKALGS
jgi:hypothetical protein